MAARRSSHKLGERGEVKGYRTRGGWGALTRWMLRQSGNLGVLGDGIQRHTEPQFARPKWATSQAGQAALTAAAASYRGSMSDRGVSRRLPLAGNRVGRGHRALLDLPGCALIVARGAQVTSSLLPTLHHSSSFPARPYGSPRGSPRGGQSPRTMTANGTRSTDLISEGVKVRKLKEALRDCTTMLQGERQVRPFAVPPPPHGRRPSRSVLTLSNKSARLACATSSPTWIYVPPSKASVFPPRAPMNTWRS